MECPAEPHGSSQGCTHLGPSPTSSYDSLLLRDRHSRTASFRPLSSGCFHVTFSWPHPDERDASYAHLSHLIVKSTRGDHRCLQWSVSKFYRWHCVRCSRYYYWHRGLRLLLRRTHVLRAHNLLHRILSSLS